MSWTVSMMLATDIYESLMDEDYDDLHRNIIRIRELIDNIEESIKDEL